MVTVEQITQAQSIEEFRALQCQILIDNAAGSDAELQRLYVESREWIRQRWCTFDTLPKPPLYRGNDPKAGIDDHVQWCDDARPAIEQIPSSFNLNIVNDFIDTLGKLLRVHQSLPWPDNDVWSKAKADVGTTPELAAATANLRKWRPHKAGAPTIAAGGSGLRVGGSVVTVQSAVRRRVARRKAMMEFRFAILPHREAIERRCRELDPAYVRDIGQAEEQSAALTAHIDQVRQTQAGLEVAAYDELAGLGLKDMVQGARFASFDNFVRVYLLHGEATAWACCCEPLDRAIRIFQGFRERIEATQPQAQPSETGSPAAKNPGAPPAGGPGPSRRPSRVELPREEAVAIAERIAENLDSLWIEPVNPPPLDETRDKGVYFSEPNRYWNQNGPWLYEQGTKKLVGRTLERRDIEQATHGLEALRRYLETNIPEWADEINTASDEIPDEVAVIYSQKRAKDNPLIALRNKMRITIGMLRGQHGEPAAEIELQKPAGAPPTPPSPEMGRRTLPTPMDEGLRSYGRRFIEALKALHVVVERRDEVTAQAVKHLAETVGPLETLVDFLRAVITAAPAEQHMTHKALGWVEYAIKMDLGGPWHALAGGAAKKEGFSYDKFVGEIETTLEALDAAQPKVQEAGAGRASQPVPQNNHNFCPVGLQVKEIGAALGMSSRARSDAVWTLLKSMGIITKELSRKQYLVAVDTVPLSYRKSFADYLATAHGSRDYLDLDGDA